MTSENDDLVQQLDTYAKETRKKVDFILQIETRKEVMKKLTNKEVINGEKLPLNLIPISASL